MDLAGPCPEVGLDSLRWREQRGPERAVVVEQRPSGVGVRAEGERDTSAASSVCVWGRAEARR